MADITTTVITKMELDASQPEKALKDVEKGQKKLGETTKKTQKDVEDQSGALGGLTGQLDKMTGGMASGVKGMGGMVKGFKGVRAAMIAIPIIALIAAITALTSWFSRSAKGQEEFAKISAGLSAVMETLKDIASAVGEALFNAFSNPKEAIKALWEAIKTNIVNRVKGLGLQFKALGDIIKNAFRPRSDEMKQALIDLASATVQVATGFDAVQQSQAFDLVTGAVKGVTAAVKESVALQERENQLRRDNIAFTVRQAELQRDIAAARLVANDQEAKLADRAAAIATATQLTNDLAAEGIRLKQEEFDIALARDAQFESTIEDAEMLAQIEAQLVGLTTARDTKLKSLLGVQKSITSEVQAEADIRAAMAADELLAESLLTETKIAGEAEYQLGRVELHGESQDDIDERNIKSAELNNQLAEEEAAVKLANSKEQANAEMALLGEFGKINKQFAIFEAIIKGAVAIAAAANPVTAVLTAARVAIQVANIASQPEPTTVRFARGGMIRGRLHSRGGTIIEAERGEAIINRRSMSNPHLRKMASRINMAGGGIGFAEQGMMVGQSGINAALGSLGTGFESSLKNNRNILVLEDLDKVRNRVDVTELTATL